MYNLVLLRPDTDSEESWSVEADPKEIRATYEGWSPMCVWKDFAPIFTFG